VSPGGSTSKDPVSGTLGSRRDSHKIFSTCLRQGRVDRQFLRKIWVDLTKDLGLSVKVSNLVCKTPKVFVQTIKSLRGVLHHLPLSNSIPLSGVELENRDFVRRFFRVATLGKDGGPKLLTKFFEFVNTKTYPQYGSVFYRIIHKYYGDFIETKSKRFRIKQANFEKLKISLIPILEFTRVRITKIRELSSRFFEKLVPLPVDEEQVQIEREILSNDRYRFTPRGYSENRTTNSIERWKKFDIPDEYKVFVLELVSVLNTGTCYLDHRFYDDITQLWDRTRFDTTKMLLGQLKVNLEAAVRKRLFCVQK